jgi:Asp-tRNA(Asn)/Glu-tRNA(Gln) amidotransferase B subunit
MKYESVIGLEVHVELKTKTKIFCGCSTEFGAQPNTHVCPVCLGLPGSMPVLNKEVLHYAVKPAWPFIATSCRSANLTARITTIPICRKTSRHPSMICLFA